MCHPSTEIPNPSLPSPSCPLFVSVSPSSPLPSSLAAGRREAARPLAPSDPVSRHQFSCILERLNILETSFPPSNGAEGGCGLKRDPGNPGGMSVPALGEQAAVEGHSLSKEGERCLGNSCLDREAMIKLTQSANHITFLKRKWKMKKKPKPELFCSVLQNVVQIYRQ